MITLRKSLAQKIMVDTPAIGLILELPISQQAAEELLDRLKAQLRETTKKEQDARKRSKILQRQLDALEASHADALMQVNTSCLTPNIISSPLLAILAHSYPCTRNDAIF